MARAEASSTGDAGPVTSGVPAASTVRARTWSPLRLADHRLQELLDEVHELAASSLGVAADALPGIVVAYSVRAGAWECRVLVEGFDVDPVLAPTVYGALESMAAELRAGRGEVRRAP